MHSRGGGVKLLPIPVSKPIQNIGDVRLQMMRYVWKSAREFDILLMYHLSKNTMVLGHIFKMRNPKGKLLVKADGAFWVERMWHYDKPFNLSYSYHFPMQKQMAIVKRYFWRWHYQRLIRELDIFAIEDYNCYSQLKNKPLIDIDISQKVRHMLNGVDTELMQRLNIRVSDIRNREKSFLTVGWVGKGVKNTDMILRAAEKVSFNGWKLYIVGPLENEDYQLTINSFFSKNPHLIDVVIFMGAIYDKSVLWKLYNSSQCYLMTSRFESFNLSMLDAYFFRLYILATEVGFTKDMFAMGCAGETLLQDNSDDLAQKMQAICNGTTNIVESIHQTKFKDVSWENAVKQLCI